MTLKEYAKRQAKIKKEDDDTKEENKNDGKVSPSDN